MVDLFMNYGIDALVFGIECGDENNDEDSTLYIGGWDSYKYPDIVWFPINTIGSWQVDFSDVYVGNFPFTPIVDSVIFDTASSYNVLPSADFDELIGTITEATNNYCAQYVDSESWWCDCENEGDDESFLTVSMVIGGNFEAEWLPTEYLNYEGDGYCTILIGDGGSDLEAWVLGDAFHRSYFILHDLEYNEVGIAGSSLDTAIRLVSTVSATLIIFNLLF